MNDYNTIFIGKVDIVIRCERCCKKIKKGCVNNKYGKYHKKCYEKEELNLTIKTLDVYTNTRPGTPPQKTKTIYFD